MKKLLFFLCITFFLFPIKVHAFDPFVKSDQNPLILSGTYNDWTEEITFQPSIIYENGIYKMWYSSIGPSDIRIGYATSSDGYSWNKQALLNPNPDLPEHDPFVFQKDGKKVLYFASSNNGTKIYKTNLTDENQYDQSSLQEVLSPSLSWEGVDNTSPSVIFKDGMYFLFYSGHDSMWRVGMATSTDGNTWTKCPQPILNIDNRDEPSDGPEIFENDGKFYLFFHMADSTGIKMSESMTLSCNASWSIPQYILKNDKEYDLNYLTSPSVIEHNGQILLYYGGKGTNDVWNINLATSGVMITPTQIPTPSPTIIPTQIPIENKQPIVIIPGIFSSWNKKALVYNEAVDSNQWILNPIVHEYDGLINTLKNLGYEEEKNLFIFNYNWRQSLDKTTEELKSFISAKIGKTEKINLIGHSLGGLIARVYQQKEKNDLINKIITVGSPHQGTLQVYKTVESGDLDKTNDYLWLAEKLLINIYRTGIKTDKQVLEEKLPVLKDLFPIFDFLIKSNGQFVSTENMYIKNSFLSSFNKQGFDLASLITIVGNKGKNTEAAYKIGPRTISDQILGYYLDGRPVETFFDTGDYTVLTKSAIFGNNHETLTLDHGELVYKKEGIRQILSSLEITANDSDIVEGKKTNINSSLFFLVFSPINLSVEYNNQMYEENNGLLFIENAQSGDYIIRAKGINNDNYSILVGQIGQNYDTWSRIDGKINNSNPSQQIDKYIVSFDKDNPKEMFFSTNNSNSYFTEIIGYLSNINEDNRSRNLTKAIEFIKNARQNYVKKQNNLLKNNLLLANREINQAFLKKLSSNDYCAIQNKLEILYGVVINNSSVNKKLIQLELFWVKNKLNLWEKYYLLTPRKIKKYNFQQSYSQIKDKLEILEKNISRNELALAEIRLINTKILLEQLFRF